MFQYLSLWLTHEAYSEGDVDIEMFEFLPSPSVGSVAVRTARVGDGVQDCVISDGVSGPEWSLREEQTGGCVIQAAQLCWSPHGLLTVRLAVSDALAGYLTLNTSCWLSLVSPASWTLPELCWPPIGLTCLTTVMEILRTNTRGELLHSVNTLHIWGCERYSWEERGQREIITLWGSGGVESWREEQDTQGEVEKTHISQDERKIRIKMLPPHLTSVIGDKRDIRKNRQT